MTIQQVLDNAVKAGQLVADDGKAFGWDDWDDVDIATIDKAFEKLPPIDARAVKVLIMEGFGVTAANIEEFTKTGEVDGMKLC